MRRILLATIIALMAWTAALAVNPMSTDYPAADCEGSLRPYPLDTKLTTCPDTLTPVMINHVGRHGARYPASSTNCQLLKRALDKAKTSGTITPLGEKLLKITDDVIKISDGRWGSLDSLGEYEQKMLASRMYKNFKPVFDNANVKAISSYSPRAMMSMYCFTHQLDRLNNKIEFSTTTGRQNSALLRPFDTDEEFKEFLKSEELDKTYKDYFTATCPVSAIERVLGDKYEYADSEQKQNLAITEYYVLAGLSAMTYPCDLTQYFTNAELNALWSCFNLRQYLQRTASTLSSIPSEIATDLLHELITTTQEWIDGKSKENVRLRFGHAETLLPLLSLMRLPGCYYLTNYFDTVAKNWKDFDIVPMASNMVMVLLQHRDNGKYYLRIDLNEKPVKYIPGSDKIYVEWETASTYLTRCLPLHAR